jgi:hypothetical protein
MQSATYVNAFPLILAHMGLAPCIRACRAGRVMIRHSMCGAHLRHMRGLERVQIIDLHLHAMLAVGNG